MFSLISAVVGMFLLFLFSLIKVRDTRFLAKASLVSGHVRDIKTVKKQGEVDDNTWYQPIVEYQAGGRRWRFCANLRASVEELRSGEEIGVYVATYNPGMARSASDMKSVSIPLYTLSAGGIICLVLSLVTFDFTSVQQVLPVSWLLLFALAAYLFFRIRPLIQHAKRLPAFRESEEVFGWK